jgi:4-amino-4-deoxy-L-arabinose transferase-like glycosyltransferase
VLDFIQQLPWRHPVEFAYDYYRQLPALTILFYPPLFYGVLAAVYAVLGISEAAALLTEVAFLFLLAWGAFRLSRHWLEPPPALAVALLLLGAPELAFWGRQIMLDVPAYAFLVWAAEFLVRHLQSGQRWTLFAAVTCVVAAAYTKYNAIFFVVPIAISLAHAYGWRVLRQRTVLQAAALGGALLLPLVGIFFAFGSYNLDQAAALRGAEASRWSITELTYYARILPSVISWPTLVFACLYVLALPFAPALRLARTDAIFLGGWLLVGYAFYSMIAVEEPRHILFITYPLTLMAVLAIDRTLASFSHRYAISLIFAVAVLAATLTTGIVPAVRVCGKPRKRWRNWRRRRPMSAFGGRATALLYMRCAYSRRRDLGVVRLDKILLSEVAVYVEHGFKEKAIKPDELTDTLRDLHVQYVVFQTRYHNDLTSVKVLEEALGSDKFSEVERIPMTANYGKGYMADLVIYRMKAEVPRGRVAPSMQIKLLGRSL